MLNDSEIAEYNMALVETLRSTDPGRLRAFADSWGKRLANPGLRQLARASDAVVEKRLWLMIRDRPDLSELHAEAETWLASHPAEETP
ncbi:MAG: hypothetical protein ACRDIY_12370 [Chloroflexota bacterium]